MSSVFESMTTHGAHSQRSPKMTSCTVSIIWHKLSYDGVITKRHQLGEPSSAP